MVREGVSWRPSAYEWLAAGGGGVPLKALVLLGAGFLAVVLIPSPALIAAVAVAAITWLVARRNR